MSADATMAVLYAQTVLTTPFANAAVVAPQAALAMSRVLAAEMARQEQQHVEKPEKSNASTVSDESGAKQHRPFGSRRARRVPCAAVSDEDESASAALSPLIGNLLNMKV